VARRLPGAVRRAVYVAQHDTFRAHAQQRRLPPDAVGLEALVQRAFAVHGKLDGPAAEGVRLAGGRVRTVGNNQDVKPGGWLASAGGIRAEERRPALRVILLYKCPRDL